MVWYQINENKLFKSDRLCLFDYIMHFILHLTKKNEMIYYKISFVTLFLCFLIVK